MSITGVDEYAPIKRSIDVMNVFLTYKNTYEIIEELLKNNHDSFEPIVPDTDKEKKALLDNVNELGSVDIYNNI
jgi:predicted CoA-binding protein